MKSIYRLIRILSCALVIATVLLCSIFVPAMAAGPKVLKPMDHLYDLSHSDDGTSFYFFGFWDNPIYQCYYNAALDETFTDSMNWELDSGHSQYRISVSPIGGTSFNSSPAALIDLSDFKSSSVMELTYTPMFRVHAYNAGPNDLTYTVKGQVSLYWYDKDFNYISFDKTSLIENTGIYGQPDFIWALDLTFDMAIPDNACYMIPRYTLVFYPPDPGAIYRIQSTEYQNFTICVQKDDILENSLTMQRIEGQLGDLNDKADEIISGSDEMHDAADDFSGTADNAQQDMDSALDQLEDLPEANPDDVDMTFDGLLSDKGFQKYANFFEFLVFDTLYVKMMVIVCTFIWVSTLLYGKRG